MARGGAVKRDKFPTRTILLRGPEQMQHAHTVLNHVPLDPDKPIEFILREEVKQRKLDQNALMWVGPLKDISEQAYIEGRTYSDVVWHEHFKELYLPDDDDIELVRLVKDKEKYRKWDITPGGKRVLVGSTMQLSIRGFALYLQKIELFGESLGVMFSAGRRAAA